MVRRGYPRPVLPAATALPEMADERLDEARETARDAGLRYVSDQAPGLRRRRRGEHFSYHGPDGEPIRDEVTLVRIRALAIPPAWTDVWISPSPNGHVQATGRDARGRKQYRYQDRWREVRDEDKYERLLDFAKALPKVRRRVARDMKRRGLPREKVLATVIRLLETTLIRVGNEAYARENRSFGLTTLRRRHTRVRGNHVGFVFRGKSGREHEVGIENRAIARIVKRGGDLIRMNRSAFYGRSGLMVSGAARTGKTTAITQLGKTAEVMHRRRYPRARDDIPVIYITVPPAATGKMIAMELARFLGLPVSRRANITDVTEPVCGVCLDAHVTLILVDFTAQPGHGHPCGRRGV